ncbi:hypothetical protein [Actinoallomurus sp. NPDC052274]|uniref:hypothetical protein n=1 Tax=Actinoallomurus sp. NPDC052274 TaxID=3155420 RepID=UPI00343B5852
MYVAGSVLVAVGIALTGVAHGPWAYAGTVVLWSVGEATVGGVPGAIVAGLAPEYARGRYQGAFQWTWGIARFAALSVGTGVYAAAGPAVVWWFSAVAGTAAALGVGALAPRIARRQSPPLPLPPSPLAPPAPPAAPVLPEPTSAG